MTLSTYGMHGDWRPARPAATARPEVGFSWEQDLGQSSVDQDAWLVSFVDILMLLLTLFVLLLAYKDDLQQPAPVAVAVATPVAATQAVEPPPMPVVHAVATTQVTQMKPPATDVNESAPQKAPTEVAVEPMLPAALTSELRLSTPPRKPMAQIAGMPGMFGLPEVLDITPPERQKAPEQSEAKTATPPTEQAVDALLAELQDSALRDRVELNVLPDSVSLEISDSILFAPASAALTTGGMQLLDELAATLKEHPYTVSVEGHTDNVPIRTARFPSNWELSSTRATEVTQRLIERGIASKRVRAVGYADTHPRADNASSEGRARNRRVSLVLMESAD